MRFAPRLDARLIGALARLDDPRRPVAETYRQIGLVAAELGLPRPSYERVRLLVHELRSGKRDSELGQVLLDISWRRRPPEALVEVLSGAGVPKLP